MLIRETAELLAAFSVLETSSEAEEKTVWGSNILSENLHVYSNFYFQGLWWRTVARHTRSVLSRSLALVEMLGFLKQLPLGGQEDGASFRVRSQEAHRGPMTLGCSPWELGKDAASEPRWLGCFAGTAKLLPLKCLSLASSRWSSRNGLAIGSRYEKRMKKENIRASD